MNWQDKQYLDNQFDALRASLIQIQKEIKTMVTNQQQFDGDLASFGTLLTTLLGLVQQILAKAQAAGVDLTTEDQTVQALTTQVQTAVNTINAALNPPAAQ